MSSQAVDVAVIGSGPAGLAAAIKAKDAREARNHLKSHLKSVERFLRI